MFRSQLASLCRDSDTALKFLVLHLCQQTVLLRVFVLSLGFNVSIVPKAVLLLHTIESL